MTSFNLSKYHFKFWSRNVSDVFGNVTFLINQTAIRASSEITLTSAKSIFPTAKDFDISTFQLEYLRRTFKKLFWQCWEYLTNL